MATKLSNHYLYTLMTGGIDWSSDTFTCLLMDTTFVFDQDAHAILTDVSADEITSTGGYARDTLTTVTVTENDTDDTCDISFDNPSWLPSGVDFDDTVGMILIDDTTATDVIVGYIDFGETLTPTVSVTFLVEDIDIRLGG